MAVDELHLRPAAFSFPRNLIRGVGIAGLALIAVVVGLADVIAGAPAGAAGIGPALVPPSAAFPLGTDLLGRDMASETLHGLVTTVDAASVGMLVALLAGGFGGFAAARLPLGLGFALREFIRILTLVPPLFLAVLLIGMTDRAWSPIAAGLAAAPAAFSRSFDRASLLASAPHGEFALLTGVSAGALLRRDLVYEFRATFLAAAARALAAVTITLSTASFFGFGATPPNRDLGLIIASAREIFLGAWWTALWPALALAFLIFCARLASGLEEGERP